MANERTFLSWMRTSLGLTTAGVGVTQLFKIANDNSSSSDILLKAGKPIGAAFILIAILCIIMGLLRFMRTQTLLQQEKYPASRISVSLLVFLVLSVSIDTVSSPRRPPTNTKHSYVSSQWSSFFHHKLVIPIHTL